MGNDKPRTNIIALYERGRSIVQNDHQAIEEDDANIFIVDMLDRLMRLAATEDQSVLVYLLAMARIEAIESKKTKDKTGL